MPLNMANSVASMVAGQLGLHGDSSRFLVVFDDGDYDLGSWSRVTGLGVQYDVVEYRCGDSNQVWTAPGLAKFSKLTLSRATGLDSRLVQEWLAETTRKPKVFSGCVQLQTVLGVPLCEWTLKAFVPCGWKIADLESKAATVVTETLELAHTGFLDNDLKIGTGTGGLRR